MLTLLCVAGCAEEEAGGPEAAGGEDQGAEEAERGAGHHRAPPGGEGQGPAAGECQEQGGESSTPSHWFTVWGPREYRTLPN